MSNRLLAFIALILTLVLMALGAYLHDAELGVTCPSWPFCPGRVADNGIIYFHRFIALCLISVSGFLSFKLTRENSMVAKWANWSFGLILLQAILGALTAVFMLPAVISFVHLVLSLVTLSTLVVLHDGLREFKFSAATVSVPSWLKDALLIVLILFFAQSLMGSLVRHTGAGASCGLGVGHLLPCTEALTGNVSWWPTHSSAQLQMLHRLLGLCLFLVALPVFVIGFFRYSTLDNHLGILARNSSFIALIFLFVQVYSGFYNIASSLAVHATVFHLIVAACLMIFTLKTRLYHQAMVPASDMTFLSDILELFKPRLAGLVMITMLIGALLVPGKIYFLDVFISTFLIFMVVASATTLNCWMERDVDAMMERTKNRALPAGRMKPATALIIGIVLGVISLPALYFIVNPLTALLGLIAHLMYLLAYTPLKKHSAAALFVGAVPGALPPVMGWTTLTGSMDATAWCLFAILFIWQLPHFLAISIYYRGDYESAGLKIYAQKSNFQALCRDIFLYTVVLMGCALAPHWWAGFGANYKIAAMILSLAFLALSIVGFTKKHSEEAQRQWARMYFFGSIIYLPLLLAAMLFFNDSQQL